MTSREHDHQEPARDTQRDRLPLSPTQQALWMDVCLQPEGVYHEAYAWEVAGRLDRARLTAAVTRVAARHELLRARLVEEDGNVSWVADRIPGAGVLEWVEDARRAGRMEALQAAAARPFDLATGPAWRCLWRGEPEGGGGALLLAFHHLIVDAAALLVVQSDLAAAYAAELPERATCSAGDVATSEWARLAAERETLTRFWSGHLDGAEQQLTWPPPIEPCPPGEETRGETTTRILRPAVAASVRTRAAEWGTTPFVVYLAAWLSVVRTHTGRDDLLTGSLATLRDTAVADGVVSYLVSPVLLRQRLEAAASFRATVASVASEWAAARAHARLPLHLVRKAAGLGAAGLRSPVQVFFSLVEPSGDAWRLGTAELRRLRLPASPVKFEVFLLVEDSGPEVRLVLEHQRGTLDAALADRLLVHVEERLAAAMAHPDAPLRELPLASAAEQQQVAAWSAPAAPPLVAGTVPELFAEVARARPDEIAVVCGNERVTYAALARRAAAVASALRAEGIGPGDRVVLSLDRGVRFIAGALGILQCGAAYVPVEPAEPASRLRQMLGPIGVRVGLRDAPVDDGGTVATWLDAAVADDEATVAEVALPPAIDGETAAYVMFTSGSTGQPKGVAVPHRGIVRLVRNQAFALMGPDERWLHLSAVAFDASTLEIWAPLLNGGRCVVVQGLPAPSDLQETIRREGVTTVWFTAALFNALIDEAPECLSGLREVLCGGEALSPAHVRRALQALPDTRLINGYGPTENTTFSTCHDITPADVTPGRTVPIGKPIVHSTAAVLDGDGKPAPIGVAGELVVGGEGVALGYVGLPEQTAARFVPDPHAARAGALRYRTGDRVRWRPEGVLEFLGRFDDQVKIHGHRIEPGEAAACLTEHPAVRQAVVVPQRRRGGELRLVAYVVPQPGTPPGSLGGVLAAHVAERLPAFLRPTAFVALDALPRTANGKLDKGALPLPDAVPAGSEAPADDLEVAVAEIFAEVLGTAVLGRDAHFFRLGGDSLQALRVVTRCRNRLHRVVSAHGLFDHPTVAAFAALLRSSEAQPAGIPLPRDERGVRFPLSPAQEALWLDVRVRPQGVYHEAFAWEVTGELDQARLAGAVAEVAERHELLRARLLEEDGQVAWAVDLVPGSGVLEWMAAMPRATRMAALEEVVARPFDLTAGPLWRCLWRGEREGGGALLLVLHHLVMDAAATRVLLAGLAAAYAGAAPETSARTHDFGDVAAWEQARLSADRKALTRFWAQHLAGAGWEVAWPTPVEPCPPGEEARGATTTRRLDAALAARVRARAADWETTPFVVYLAAWLTVVRNYTGRNDLVVGTPATLRDTAAAEEVVGYLLSPVLVRAAVEPAASFRATVASMAAEWAAVRAHARLPLHFVLHAAGRRTASLRSPVQVFFSLVQPVGGALRLGTAEARPLDLEALPAKFEVFLLVEDGGPGADVRLVLEYQRGTLDTALADGLLAHVEERLATALTAPDVPLEDLALRHPPAPPSPPSRRAAGDREAAAREAGPPRPGAATSASDAASPSPLAAEILRIWRNVLGNERLGLDDNFFQSGGDSLLAVRMLARVARLRGEHVPAGLLMQAATVRRFAALLEAGGVENGYPRAITVLRPGVSRRRLFCLPGLGGAAFQFQSLASRLRTTRTILSVEIHDLDAPPSTLDSLEETAAAVVGAMRQVQPEGPYALIGYSYGGNLAVEVARRLIADGQEVALAAVLGAFHPDAVRAPVGARKLATHLRIIRRLDAREAFEYVRARLSRKLLLTTEEPAPVAVLPADRERMKRRRHWRFTPPPVSDTEQRLEQVIERGYLAVERHRPAPFPGRIALLYPTQLPDWVELDDPSGTCGWGPVCQAGVEVIPLACGHFDLLMKPGLDLLSAALNQLLARLDAAPSA